MRQFIMLLSVILAFAVFAPVASPAIADEHDVSARAYEYTAHEEPDGSVSYTFDHVTEFEESEKVSMTGTRDGDTCMFASPTLSLEPDETAAMSRLTYVNYETCEITYEVGIPSDSSISDENETSSAYSEPQSARKLAAWIHDRMWHGRVSMNE